MRVCMCSSVLAGSGGPPPGRVLVRLTSFSGLLVFLLCSARSGLGMPILWFFGCPPPPFFFLLSHFPRAPLVSFSFFGFRPLGALGLGALFFFPPPTPACVFFFFVVRPRGLWRSLVSGPGCPGPWRCVLFVLLASRSSALCALSPLLWFPPGRWLLPGGCCTPRLSSVSRCFSRCCFVLRFFFSLYAPVVPGFLWFPAPGTLGLGAVCCLFCWPPASRLSVCSHLFCGSRVAVGCSLVVAPPPLFCVSLFFSLPLCAPFFFSFSLRAPVVSGFLQFPVRVPRAFALCAVCLVGLPLLGSPCALASFVVPVWPLAAPWC